MRILTKISSNNELQFSVGNNLPPKRQKLQQEVDISFVALQCDLAVEKKQKELESIDLKSRYLNVVIDENLRFMAAQGRFDAPFPVARQGAGAFLDITCESQEHDKKPLLDKRSRIPRWGRVNRKTVFTSKARHTLLEAGAVVDKGSSLANCRFLTLTIPGSSFSGFKAVARWSGFLVNRLTQIIRDSRHSAYIGSFFCWEFQNRGALHLHWLICDFSQSSQLLIHNLALKLRDAWYNLLFVIESKEKNKVDLFGKWRNCKDIWNKGNIIQTPRKSVAAYLCKYASKEHASSIDSMKGKSSFDFYPSRWWGCNQIIRKKIKEWQFDSSFDCASEKELSIIERYLDPFFNGATKQQGYRFVKLLDGGKTIWSQTKFFYFPPDQWEIYHRSLKDLLTEIRYFQEYKKRKLAQFDVSVLLPVSDSSGTAYPLFNELVSNYLS